MKKRTLLLFRKKTSWCEAVRDFCAQNYELYEEDVLDHYDLIVSFLSPIIIPKEVLRKGDIKINFHPGNSKYPGIGCYNFALFSGEKMYGVVCHEMEETVDTGRIMVQKTFHISKNETVLSLQQKSMYYLTALAFDVLGNLAQERQITYNHSSIPWMRKPYTHKDLEDLCSGDVFLDFENDAPSFEIWYNACYYPKAKDRPYFTLGNKKYYIVREDHVDDRSDVSWYNYTY